MMIIMEFTSTCKMVRRDLLLTAIMAKIVMNMDMIAVKNIENTSSKLQIKFRELILETVNRIENNKQDTLRTYETSSINPDYFRLILSFYHSKEPTKSISEFTIIAHSIFK